MSSILLPLRQKLTSCIRSPFAPEWADPLAARIWDQLETQVEKGVKAAAGGEQGKTAGESGKKVSFA